jgi:hypothetical protein
MAKKKQRLYTDKEIDAKLVELWNKNDGGPDDGYKIAEVRRLTRRVFKNLARVDELLDAPVVDMVALDKALAKLVDDKYDPKHKGFCWPDVADSIGDMCLAVLGEVA